MKKKSDEEMIHLLKTALQPLTGDKKDYDSLLETAKNKKFVLIGESTHGTKEFYQIRAELTKRLIEDHGFSAVAIEGDWPDAYFVNYYINHSDYKGDAVNALSKFERFPVWMWQNKEVLAFVEWLRNYNLTHSAKTHFYGLDLYSMHSSISAVISYLKKIDKAAADKARQRYTCLDSFTLRSFPALEAIENSCREKIIKQLIELRQQAFEYLKKDGFTAEEEFFCAEQNAILIKDAQEYYRSLYYGERSSWNIRDIHMAQTLDNLSIHLEKILKKPAKIIVWAHNSHIGDARATDMNKRGEINLGQLVREKYGAEALLIGFSTYQGTVTAASDWDMPVERKTVLPALPQSVEYLFHQTFHQRGVKNFILKFADNQELSDYLNCPLLQRFIGVIYLPETERFSHYYHVRISKQFDVLIYVNETTAVEPLKIKPKSYKGEIDDTYPFGV